MSVDLRGTETIEERRTRREAKFAVEVARAYPHDSDDPNEIKIGITNNGFQWTSFTITRRNAQLLVDALTNFLDEPGR